MLPGCLLEDDLFAGSIVWQFAQNYLRETSKFVHDLFDCLVVGLSREIHFLRTKLVPVVEYARRHMVWGCKVYAHIHSLLIIKFGLAVCSADSFGLNVVGRLELESRAGECRAIVLPSRQRILVQTVLGRHSHRVCRLLMISTCPCASCIINGILRSSVSSRGLFIIAYSCNLFFNIAIHSHQILYFSLDLIKFLMNSR